MSELRRDSELTAEPDEPSSGRLPVAESASDRSSVAESASDRSSVGNLKPFRAVTTAADVDDERALIPSTSAAVVGRTGVGLTEPNAADFATTSEKRRRIVDTIGFGGTILGSMLFVAPLAGIAVPIAVPMGLVAGCLTIFGVGKALNDRHDFQRLRSLGLTKDDAERAISRYLRARIRIPNGAKSSARTSRLARALLETDGLQ